MKINKTSRFCFIVGLWIFILGGIVYAADHYSVGPGQTVTVSPAGGGDAYDVKNNSTKTYFIPNKTSVEWNAFLNACQGRLSGDLTCTKVIVPPTCLWGGECGSWPGTTGCGADCCPATANCGAWPGTTGHGVCIDYDTNGDGAVDWSSYTCCCS